ncbi:HNH endonuclease signature motif containing protein, partial [Actinomycetes bacterium KLBMP 9797]
PRSMDELRADLFLDILNGENLPEVGHHRGGVEIAVSLTTLMGLSKEPGDLHGWGPVIAEVARTTVEQQLKATWKASVYDDNGELVHHGRLRRRPSTADAAFVKTRDRTCRAPGCRTPAHHADLDHTKAWEDDGHTIPANLGVLCRHCHGYKHSDGVTLEQPHPGEFIWHTRLGHTYHIKPEPP